MRNGNAIKEAENKLVLFERNADIMDNKYGSGIGKNSRLSTADYMKIQGMITDVCEIMHNTDVDAQSRDPSIPKENKVWYRGSRLFNRLANLDTNYRDARKGFFYLSN